MLPSGNTEVARLPGLPVTQTAGCASVFWSMILGAPSALAVWALACSDGFTAGTVFETLEEGSADSLDLRSVFGFTSVFAGTGDLD